MFFSKKVNLNPIFEEKSMDMISLEEKSVIDFLREDLFNFIIVQAISGKNFVHFVNVKNIFENIEDGTVFPCNEVGTVSISNVDSKTELFNARRISTIYGYLDMNSFLEALENVTKKNKRIYFLDSIEEQSVKAVVSKLHFQGRTGMVSANHCQGGSEGNVFNLVEFKVKNIPKLTNLDDPILETDSLLIVLLWTIVKRSTIKSKILKNTTKEILSIGQGVFSLPGWVKDIKFDAKVGNIHIETTEQLRLLQKWAPIYSPSIRSITIDVLIEDFSFMKYLKNVQKFVCNNSETNSSALIHELNHYDKTLRTMSLYSTRIFYQNMSNFTNLLTITIKNKGINTYVFESSLKRITELPRVLSINVDSDKSPSPNLFKILSQCVSNPSKLHVSSKGFNGELDPISKLEFIHDLYLNLPLFTGTFLPLRNLNFNKLKVATGAVFDIITSDMGITHLDTTGNVPSGLPTDSQEYLDNLARIRRISAARRSQRIRSS